MARGVGGPSETIIEIVISFQGVAGVNDVLWNLLKLRLLEVVSQALLLASFKLNIDIISQAGKWAISNAAVLIGGTSSKGGRWITAPNTSSREKSSGLVHLLIPVPNNA